MHINSKLIDNDSNTMSHTYSILIFGISHIQKYVFGIISIVCMLHFILPYLLMSAKNSGRVTICRRKDKGFRRYSDAQNKKYVFQSTLNSLYFYIVYISALNSNSFNGRKFIYLSIYKCIDYHRRLYRVLCYTFMLHCAFQDTDI
jgi:hypothetical protein